MKALRFSDKLELITKYPKPIPKQNEALIKVLMAGICNTDIEITKGYREFKGILGHEFVGIVEEINGDIKNFLGKRVVGEINCACGNPGCYYCNRNLGRHCPNRSVLGIFGKDGCMAEYITLPVNNLLIVPDSISDEEATFCEPLSAGFEILEQIHIQPTDNICILGDGKLGLLIDFVLQNTMANITHIGKYKEKLDIVAKMGIKTLLLDNFCEEYYDIVVEATGTANGFETSLQLVKPRGKLILKSTIVSNKENDLTSIVVNEITVVGSRCGQFAPALKALEKYIDVKPLISAVYPFGKSLEAFERAKEKGVLKILLDLR